MGTGRVRFCTGRDRCESEARASAGVHESHKKAGWHPQHTQRSKHSEHLKQQVDMSSLDQEMCSIVHGLQTSDDTWQLQKLLGDSVQLLGRLKAQYEASDVIRNDANGLYRVLGGRRAKLLDGASSMTRYHLDLLSHDLVEAAAEHARRCSAKCMQRASSRPLPAKFSKNAKTRIPKPGR